MSRFYSVLIFLTLATFSRCYSQSRFEIKGLVVDAVTSEPLAFASVAVLQKNNDQSSIIGAAQTTIDGTFSIGNLPGGNFSIQITYVGYQTFEKTATLSGSSIFNMETIALQVDSKILKEVEVVGEKSQIEITPGKRIFNVDKNLTSTGGTAESLLRNVPSITVDETGAASLRNMPTTIYVNGKPTQLTLAQIPANQIASIEVISNPSARYDASTSGGIVNLVMKRNKEPGYNGIVSLGVGNNSRYDATLNLDWQKGKWNITTLYSLNATKNPLNGYAHRQTKDVNGSITNYFDQTTLINLNNRFQSGRVAADYLLDKNNTLTLATNIVAGSYNTLSNQAYAYKDLSQSLTSYGSRNTVPQNNYTNTGLEFDWKHSFVQKGRELQFTSSFTRSRVSNAGDWFTTAYDVGQNGAAISQEGYPLQNRIDGRIIGNQVLGQLDYVHPVSESAKWEIGLRSFSYLRDQQYLFSEVHSETKTLLQNYSQNAQIDETVNAIYALYSKQMNDRLSIQGGLRMEQSSLHGLSHFDETKFGYNYPSKTGQNLFQSFFPSFSVNKKINEESDWSLSLSRKVGRPNFRHMFVGIQANDKQNITIGNPQVRPEFVNTAELSYNKTWNGQSGSSLQWLSTGYYIYEDHTIKPVTQPLTTDSTVLVTTFQNVKADIQYGVDNTLNYSAGPISVVAGFNLYETIIQSINITTQMLRYSGKLNVTYKFGKGFSAQVSAQRRSKSPSLQGYQRAVTGADFALRKGFWRNRASVTFIVNDIFNSRKFISIYDQPLTYQTSMSRREIRYYKLTLQLPLSRATNKTKERRVSGPDIDFSSQ
jgi:outer membrane receptor protein involved in Fe transport